MEPELKPNANIADNGELFFFLRWVTPRINFKNLSANLAVILVGHHLADLLSTSSLFRRTLDLYQLLFFFFFGHFIPLKRLMVFWQSRTSLSSCLGK